MISLFRIICCLCLALAVSSHGQELMGGEIVLQQASKDSAQAATQALGNEVLKQNFTYAVDKMYPRWLQRQAKRMGSEVKLRKALEQVGEQMDQAGITIDAFVAMPAGKAFHVHPKKKAGVQQIRTGNDVDYEILVIVPTEMKMSFYSQEQAKRSFLRKSFQIAISKDAGLTWTFIDGATLKKQDLRSIFPLLPQQLTLPEKVDTALN